MNRKQEEALILLSISVLFWLAFGALYAVMPQPVGLALYLGISETFWLVVWTSGADEKQEYRRWFAKAGNPHLSMALGTLAFPVVGLLAPVGILAMGLARGTSEFVLPFLRAAGQGVREHCAKNLQGYGKLIESEREAEKVAGSLSLASEPESGELTVVSEEAA